jgi:hypothetical protein
LKIRPEIKLTQVNFLKKNRVSLALAVQLKKKPKWPHLHKVLSALQRLLHPVKSTSGNVKKKIYKKSEVFPLPLAISTPNFKEFG